MSSYNVQNIKGNITFNFVILMCGMIYNFSEDNPLTAYVMKGEVNEVELSERNLEYQRSYLLGSKISGLHIEITKDKILNPDQREKLISVANYFHPLQQNEGIPKAVHVLQDFKIVTPPGMISRITGCSTVENVLQQYHNKLSGGGRLKFVLRRTFLRRTIFLPGDFLILIYKLPFSSNSEFSSLLRVHFSHRLIHRI